MKVLYVDCAMRSNSRTKQIANAFFQNLDLDEYEVIHLKLDELNLKYLANDFFTTREEELQKGNFAHHRFDYAKQFQKADRIVISAPFWDLSFPALLKVYFENVSVDGITFKAGENGLVGNCNADQMIFFTSRGGFYPTGSHQELATPYLKGLCEFFGIDEFICVGADGMDVAGYDSEGSLEQAREEARKLANVWNQEI